MSQITSLPSYNELNRALEKTQSAFQAAEVHGMLCGIICATSGRIPTQWEKLVAGEKENKQSNAILQQLHATSYQQLNEFSFEFTLLLPENKTDINIRTEALGLWCQGFLTGLQQTHIPLKNRATPEIMEALNDITEIAQVEHGHISSTEEDESAYFELTEYVRLAILMIYHEFTQSHPENLHNNNSLH
jgi:yecA family protein